MTQIFRYIDGKPWQVLQYQSVRKFPNSGISCRNVRLLKPRLRKFSLLLSVEDHVALRSCQKLEAEEEKKLFPNFFGLGSSSGGWKGRRGLRPNILEVV